MRVSARRGVLIRSRSELSGGECAEGCGDVAAAAQQMCGDCGDALYGDVRDRAGYAEGGDGATVLIEDGSANATDAELYLFVVDGIAAVAYFLESVEKSLAGAEGLLGVAYEANL